MNNKVKLIQIRVNIETGPIADAKRLNEQRIHFLVIFESMKSILALNVFFAVLLCSTTLSAQVGLQLDQEPWLLQTSEQQPLLSSSAPRYFSKYHSPFSTPSSKIIQTPIAFKEQPELGLFCKLDANMDSKLPYRLRFRLGEYHYVQALEGYEQYQFSNSKTEISPHPRPAMKSGWPSPS